MSTRHPPRVLAPHLGAVDRPDLIDTVRSKPDMVTARASLARLELAAQTGALNLAVDTAETIKARNSLEKMLAHVSSIEASRLANSAARMMESFNQGLPTITCR